MFNKINRFIPEKWHWVLNHGGFRKYFKNTGWMFLGQIISLAMSFFIGAWIARYLGPENYGVLSYSIAFAGLFAFIASLGVDGIVSRELVAEPEKKDELLGTAFVLKLIGGFLASSITIVSIFILETSPLIRALVSLFSLTYIFQATQVISLFFQSRVEAKNSVRAQVVAAFISSILKVILIFSGYGIIWLMVIYVLDSVWLSLLLFIEYKKRNFNFGKWTLKSSLSKKILKSSWLLMLSSASAYIYMKVDQVMIGKMLGDFSVGIYSAAVKFVEVWYFIPGLICVSLFPAIINAKKIDKSLYLSRLKNLFLLLLFLSIIIAMPTTIFAKWGIKTLFGSEYILASGVLQIYIWSGVGLFLGWGINQYLLSEDRINTIFLYNTVSMIMNIGLNFLFIPLFGLYGAAWATLISYIVAPVLFFIFRKKEY